MSTEKEKHIGTSHIIGNPYERLVLKQKDESINTRHLANKAVTKEKMADGAVGWDELDHNLQNIIETGGGGGGAGLATDWGISEKLGITQKKLTEEHEAVSARIGAVENDLADNYYTKEQVYTKNETYSKEQLNSLITTPEQEYENYTATSETTTIASLLPEEGEADTTYRVGCWNGTEYDDTKFSEYGWDGTQYILLNVQTPGIDEEPTAGSDNLVKSGGSYNGQSDLQHALGYTMTPVSITSAGNGYVQFSDGEISGSGNAYFFHSEPISVSAGETVLLECVSSSSMAAIAKYELVNGDAVYTPLVKGKGASALNRYMYHADTSISIVVSGYTDSYTTVSKSFSKSHLTKMVSNGTIQELYDEDDKIWDVIGEVPIETTRNWGYIDSSGELQSTSSTTFFHTDPITVAVGETIVAKTYAAGTMSAIAQVDIISNTVSYTPLVVGVKYDSLIEYRYTNKGNGSIQVVVSGYNGNFNETVLFVQKGGMITTLEGVEGSINALGVQFVEKDVNNGFVKWNGGEKGSASEIIQGSSSNFFYTNPITLSEGDIIAFRISATSPFAALSEYEEEDSVSYYTPLVRGNTSTYEVKDFAFRASKDMQVVISGYRAGGAYDKSYWYIEKYDKIIERLESRISDLGTTINIFSAYQNVIAVGDSLTYSAVYTDASNWRQAYNPWPKQIAAMSGVENSAIYAYPGYNASQVWTNFKDSFEVPNDKKTLCIIYLGTNGGFTDTVDTDAAGDDPDNWTNNYVGNMCRIINKFVTLGAKILLILPHTVGTSDPEHVSYDTTINALMDMVEKFDCAYVDDAEIYNSADKYHLYPDLSGRNSLHYNDLGYAYFASSLIDKAGKMESNNMKYIIPD